MEMHTAVMKDYALTAIEGELARSFRLIAKDNKCRR